MPPRNRDDLRHPKTVTIFVSVFFLMNFTVGASFLGVPFTFVHGGVLIASCTLGSIVFIACTTALYEVETMARAQALSDLNDGKYDNLDVDKPNFRVEDSRKFEITELCDIFIGKWFKFVYIFGGVIFNGILVLVTYTIIATTSWAVNFPLNFASLRECIDADFLHQYFPLDPTCGNTYRLCLSFFALIVVPISLLNLHKQAAIQLVIGLLRFMTVLFIAVYCLYHILSDDLFVSNRSVIDANLTLFGVAANVTTWEYGDISLSSYSDIIFRFNFEGWVISIPVILVTLMMHQGVPGLVHPIKEKKWLKWIFILLFLTIACLYLTFSILGALCFRDITNETFTLNWVPFTSSDNKLFVRVLSYWIILFPSIDACSVYPLAVHVIANNIYVLLFSRDTSQETGLLPSLILLAFKFVISLVPISISLFVTNLVYVSKYAGLSAFFVGLICPIVLQLRSQWICVEKFSFITTIKKTDSDEATCNKDSAIDDNSVLDEATNPFINKTTTVKKVPFSARKVASFFFSPRHSVLYCTPYSTVVSHPLLVATISSLIVILMFLTIISLFYTISIVK